MEEFMLEANQTLLSGDEQPDEKLSFHDLLNRTPLSTEQDVDVVMKKHITPLLMKVHGIVMSGTWMLICAVAMLIARYHKNAWPNSTIYGKPVWFQLHRGLNMLVLVLTFFGVGIAFWYAGPYHELDNIASVMRTVHPPCGVATFAIVIAQPIIAYFRPAPHTPMRFWWWCTHTTLGLIAYALAHVNIYISFGHPNGVNPIAETIMCYLLYAYWGITICVVLILEQHKYYIKRINEVANEKTPLKKINYEEGDELSFYDTLVVENGSHFLKSVLAFYIGAITLCWFGWTLCLMYHGMDAGSYANPDTDIGFTRRRSQGDDPSPSLI